MRKQNGLNGMDEINSSDSNHHAALCRPLKVAYNISLPSSLEEYEHINSEFECNVP